MTPKIRRTAPGWPTAVQADLSRQGIGAYYQPWRGLENAGATRPDCLPWAHNHLFGAVLTAMRQAKAAEQNGGSARVLTDLLSLDPPCRFR
jgi:hypothetical protein